MHSRTADEKAIALAFELLLSGDDIRRQPLIERKNALKWVLRKAREGIQYFEHAEGHGDKLFAAVCNLVLEWICRWPFVVNDRGRRPLPVSSDFSKGSDFGSI